MDPSSLTMIGKYEIRGTLGRGAMGIVYDGWDPQIDRQVAIKTVRLLDVGDADAVEALARFKREAQAAGRLTHPNIVGVYDYGQTSEMAGGDIAYIVMEFVEGQSLKALLDAEERFPVGETVRVMEELLAGLQFSHARGVIHRDIKPANVMVTTDGRVKIADFGIARIESSSMTQAGTVMGTPAYMSPEQFMGQAVDARTDVYSSGVLLYQMLTGERPFEGSLTAIMHKVLNTTPPRPSELSVVAPPALDPVVVRAMQRRPEDRFASAAEFAQALRRAFETPAAASLPGAAAPASGTDATIIASPTRGPTPSAAAPSAATSRGSNPVLLGGVAAVALLMAGGGAWFALRPSGTAAPIAAPSTQHVLPAPSTAPAAPPASPPAPPPIPERQASLPDKPVAAPSPPAAPAPGPALPTPAPAPPPGPARGCAARAGAASGWRTGDVTSEQSAKGRARAAQSVGDPSGAGRGGPDSALRAAPLQRVGGRADRGVGACWYGCPGIRPAWSRGGRRAARADHLADARLRWPLLRRAEPAAANRPAEQPVPRAEPEG